MYTILDARTVFQKNGGKQAEVNLIRIQNPWNEAQEWRGKCCDLDEAFWTPEVKAQFNSHDILVTAGGKAGDTKTLSSSRYSHQWYQDDGIFVMRVEEFVQYFNQLVVCRPFPENHFGVEFGVNWKPVPTFLPKKSVMNDRQFVFTLESVSQAVKVTAVLTQDDPRLNQELASEFKQHRAEIGLCVMNMGKGSVVQKNERVTSYNPDR